MDTGTCGVNPMLEEEGKNPFVMDSKEPDWTKFQEFLGNEVRYTSLQKSNPTEASDLYVAAQNNAMWRYKSYQRLSAETFNKFDETSELPK